MSGFKVSFLLMFLIMFLTKCYTQDDIHIVFLVSREGQDETVSSLNNTIRDIQKSYVNTIIPQYMALTDDQTKDSIDQLCRLLYAGISVVMDFTQKEWTEGEDLIISSKVVYLKVDLGLHNFLAGLEDFIRVRKGKDAVLIFQNNYELQEGLRYLITRSSLRVLPVNGFKPDLSRQLENLRPLPAYYGIIADGKNVKTICNELFKTRLFKHPDKWHIVILDGNVDALDTKMLPPNITLIRLNENYVYRADQVQYSTRFKDQILFAILQIIQQNHKIMRISRRKFSCKEHFNATRRTDVDFDESGDSLIKAFQNSEVLKFEANTLTYRLNLSIETVTANGKTLTTAAWNDGTLEFTMNNIKPAKRFFRIGTTEAIPWSFIKRNPITQETLLDDEGNPLWEGYCIDLIRKLAEIMKFDYEIVAPRSGTFGKRSANGTWNGIVGDLVSGETDIAVAALKMTAEREEVIDFIAPYYDHTGISIVIRKPFRQTSLFKFMTVLRLEVWMSIITALVATALMIWLLDKYSPYSARNNPTAYPYVCRDFTLKESFWFALTSFTPQGGGEVPKSISARTLVAAYWLFVVLMLATFTANLAAFLTVERMQTPVQSLEQLARQSRINYTVVESSDTHKYFINMKFAEDTLYRLWKELTLNASSDQSQYRIWEYPIREQYGHILLAINSSNPVRSADEGFKKVSDHDNSDFAFIHDSAEIKYEISQNCNLTEIGEIFAEQPYAIAVQQGSHLQDELSFAILDLQKNRFFESLTAKYWNNSKKDCDNVDESEGITLESLGGVFIATLFGLGLAMVTLVCEVAYYRRKSPINSNITLASGKESKGVKPKPVKLLFANESYKKKMKNKKMPLTLAKEFKPARKRTTKITYIQPADTTHMPYYYE